MLQKIVLNLTAALSILLVSLTAVPVPAFAACPSATSAKGQVLQGVGETGGNCSGSGVNHVIRVVVNILSYVVGIAAIIVIILAGFRFITSGGDSSRVASAKNALVYAVIGLIVAALAQVIVHFVLANVA